MPYSLQVKNAKASIALRQIAGTCPSSEEFLAMLNESMRRLDRRGNFFGREQLMRFCVYNGCITWPRIVGTPLGVRTCGCSDTQIRNNWYSILGPIGNDRFSATHTIRDGNLSPTYNTITGTDGKLIRAYITKRADIGKTITLFGTDANGQPLQQKIGGVWQRGLTLTLAAPYVETLTQVREILSVVKDVTQSNVLLYEFDSATATMRDLAIYEPTETNPNYRQSFINNFSCLPSGGETNGVRYRPLECLVKLAFIECFSDEDFLPIDNLDAIKMMIQAIRLEEEGKDAETIIAKAVRELNFEDRDKSPGEQITVRVNPVGRTIYSPI